MLEYPYSKKGEPERVTLSVFLVVRFTCASKQHAQNRLPDHPDNRTLSKSMTKPASTTQLVHPLGQHIIVDIFDASNLIGEQHIEEMMIECANAANATILKTHLHPFETNGGVSGMIILAESHISIHTWPEYNFAAMDIFMCGDAQPELCLAVIEQCFQPGKMVVNTLTRGGSVSQTGEFQPLLHNQLHATQKTA
ncbi:adenosylmethionine decarboxylase [Pseudoalteromonas rubra]|nr:adenosylmethionine decarboxylase [Pseudoalteromonas rubra]